MRRIPERWRNVFGELCAKCFRRAARKDEPRRCERRIACVQFRQAGSRTEHRYSGEHRKSQNISPYCRQFLIFCIPPAIQTDLPQLLKRKTIAVLLNVYAGPWESRPCGGCFEKMSNAKGRDRRALWPKGGFSRSACEDGKLLYGKGGVERGVDRHGDHAGGAGDEQVDFPRGDDHACAARRNLVFGGGASQ